MPLLSLTSQSTSDPCFTDPGYPCEPVPWDQPGAYVVPNLDEDPHIPAYLQNYDLEYVLSAQLRKDWAKKWPQYERQFAH